MNEAEYKPACKYYVTRKKRNCRMVAMKDSEFCAEHYDNKDPKTKRIPCPVDPKHSVFETKLKNHLKLCNANKCRSLEYFSESLNSGQVDTATESNEKSELLKLSDDVSDEELRSVLMFLLSIKSKLNLTQLFDSDSGNQCEYKIKNDKHSYQYYSLIENMKQKGCLNFLETSQNEALLEFGAGKGGFCHFLTKYTTENTIDDLLCVLIDRQGVRNRFDAQHKSGPIFKRILMDIEHLNLIKVSYLREKRCTIVSKHLCGCATDLTLNCLKNWINSHEESVKLEDISNGVVIALCCHHKCTWKHYVNKDWMLSIGISRRLFQIICLLSSWATCGEVKRFETLFESKPDLSSTEYGRLCKRIIDEGRVLFLQKLGFKSVNIESYIGVSVTPENTALFATPL